MGDACVVLIIPGPVDCAIYTQFRKPEAIVIQQVKKYLTMLGLWERRDEPDCLLVTFDN